MSAKWRMVLWFTLMMLLLAGVTLTFVLVMNGSVIANPTSQVVREVSRRADDIEFDNGTFDWDDMKEYKHGVYCTYYDAGGTYLRGAMPFAEAVALPLQTGAVRPYSADGKNWLVYDSYVDMTITGLWVRGVFSADAAAGPGRVILPLTWSLLPVLLLLSIGGGWLIARDSFLPLERITEAAGSISDGDDLSARLDLRRGPREMRRLARTFDGMFARLETSFLSKKQASETQLSVIQTSGLLMFIGGLQSLVGAAVLGEFSTFSMDSVTPLSAGALLYLVIFGAIIAYTCYFWLLLHTRTVVAISYEYVNPVIGVFLGWLLAGEQVDGVIVTACCLTVLSVFFIVSRKHG